MWPGNILSAIQFKYFSLLSNTIYSMNSVDITRNKRECIQNNDRNYFLVISNKRPVKVEMSNRALFVNTDQAMHLLKTRENVTTVFTPNDRRGYQLIINK